ncbi:hypothetical protein K1719_000785 [Acacia pycnantha]|nr:hypothetical protein K1719_000785 [Acacia pycnantha]
MLAIMRRVDNIDKRHTLHYRRRKSGEKTDPHPFQRDWEDKTWREDDDDESSAHRTDRAAESVGSGRANRRNQAGVKRVDLGRGTIEVTGTVPKWFQRRRYVTKCTIAFLQGDPSARFPEKLNLGELTKYDGTQDPTTHLEDFGVHMSVRGLKEPIVPRIFAATLKGGVEMASHSSLWERAKNLNDFISRSKKYLDVERDHEWQTIPIRGGTKIEPPSQGSRLLDNRNRIPEKGNENKSRGGKFDRRSKYEKYSATAVPRSQVWKEVSTTEMKKVDRPRLSYRRSGIDQSKYCSFHDGRGHTTDECYELRDAIERFVREGKLQQYVIEHQGKGGKRKTKNRSRTPPRKFKSGKINERLHEADSQFPKRNSA